MDSRLYQNSNLKNTKNKPPKKKINFKLIKKNTICSLNEVEYFLCDFSRFCKYIKLYKFLK